MSALSTTPDPPYYAVIFASTASSDTADYAEAAARMTALAARQPGFLGVDSARSDGVGITVSYWETEAAIRSWKAHAEHTLAREDRPCPVVRPVRAARCACRAGVRLAAVTVRSVS